MIPTEKVEGTIRILEQALIEGVEIVKAHPDAPERSWWDGRIGGLRLAIRLLRMDIELGSVPVSPKFLK